MKMMRASEYSSGLSVQTYQSLFGLSWLSRDSWNHGWSDEVWLTTRSTMTRIPRSCAASTKARKSSTVP